MVYPAGYTISFLAANANVRTKIILKCEPGQVTEGVSRVQQSLFVGYGIILDKSSPTDAMPEESVADS